MGEIARYVYVCVEKNRLAAEEEAHQQSRGEWNRCLRPRKYFMAVVDKLGRLDATIYKDLLTAMLLSGDTCEAIRVRISPDGMAIERG